MNAKTYISYLFPKTVQYKLARKGLVNPGNPITLTFSVTAACQSLCKTCQIGDRHRQNPQRAKDDLTLDEIEKIFRRMGHVYFFNISGGEPFLRKDLPRIVELACKYLQPGIVHTPTNALAPKRIEELTREILDVMNRLSPGTPFTVKPSIDGVGDKHDEIRGVKGNFAKLEETISRLKEVQNQYPAFHLELGTVVSNFNIHNLEEIEDYVHSLGCRATEMKLQNREPNFLISRIP